MKITLPTRQALKTVSIAKAAIENKATIAVLQSVVLSVADYAGSYVAFSVRSMGLVGEIIATSRVDVPDPTDINPNPFISGSLCVSASHFEAILKALPADSVVTFDVSGPDEMAIRCVKAPRNGNSASRGSKVDIAAMSIPTVPAERFPPRISFVSTPVFAFTVDGIALAAALDKVLFCADPLNQVVIRQGVHLSFSGGVLALAATDGRRASRAELKIDNAESVGESVVHAFALQQLCEGIRSIASLKKAASAGNLEGNNGDTDTQDGKQPDTNKNATNTAAVPISVSLSPAHALFESPGLELVGAVCAGKFSPVDLALKQFRPPPNSDPTKHTILVDRAELLSAMKRVRLFMDIEGKGVNGKRGIPDIYIDFKGDRRGTGDEQNFLEDPAMLEITGGAQSKGRIAESVYAEYLGKDFNMKLNPEYLQEAIGHIDSSTVTLQYSHKNRAALLILDGMDGGFTHMLMPMEK